jgi:IclR family acetate operon transcriptional repressor
MRIVRALSYATAPKSVAELSLELGLHKVTLVRLLRTLMSEGVAVQEAGTKRYAWNPASLIRLVAFMNPVLAVAEAVQQTLDEVAATAGGTMLLFVPHPRGRVAYVAAQALPDTPVRFEIAVLPPAPLHSVAGGKCYLAHLPEADLEAYIRGGLISVSERTITSPERLRGELASVRELGYALNRGEGIGQSDGVAVPLHGASGDVIGGVSLAYPGAFPRGFKIEATAGVLRQSAEALSVILSYDWWASRARESRSRMGPRQLAPNSPDPGFGDDAIPAVRSSARAMRILSLLLSVPEGVPASEVARRRGLSALTATRLLRTLERESVIVRDAPMQGYRVNPLPWIRIASFLRSAAGLVEMTRAVLQRLSDATDMMSSITAPDPTGRLLVDQQVVISNRPVRVNRNENVFAPLHATSGGKCYLAHQSPGWLERYIEAGLPTWTGATITSAQELMRELALTRERGYALNIEETSAGVGAIAVPLRDTSGRVVGAVTLTSVVSEFTRETVRQWLPLLREAAERLSGILAPDWRERLSGPA